MTMPEILVIVAQSDNGAIGCDGKMPWHLPRDLQYFKAQTLGHPVIRLHDHHIPFLQPVQHLHVGG